MQEAGESGGVDSATVARLARSLFAPDPGAVPQLAELLAAAPMAVSAAEAAEAEELDVSYVRSKGSSVLFGPLVKCAPSLPVSL